jgi:prepilin signal peptidase PulO-like enzyme (type II secretory pathway)
LQYPLVELITGFFFGLATFFYPFKMITLSESFIFSAFLILLTVTDLKWKLLPHSFTHLFLMIGLVLSCIPKIHLLLSPAQSLLGMLVGGGLLLIISELVPGGMGGGDVKFASGLGSWLGLYGLLRVFIIAFLLGGLTAGSLLFLKKANRKTAIALGPFLSVGALLVWFFPNVVGFWMKGIAL